MEDASVAVDDVVALAAAGSSSYAAAAARAPPPLREAAAAAAAAALRCGRRPPEWLARVGGELPRASGFYAVRLCQGCAKGGRPRPAGGGSHP
jgi:hypothetical protein